MEIIITEGEALVARIPLGVAAPLPEPVEFELESELPQSIKVSVKGNRVTLSSRTVPDGTQLLPGQSVQIHIPGVLKKGGGA